MPLPWRNHVPLLDKNPRFQCFPKVWSLPGRQWERGVAQWLSSLAVCVCVCVVLRPGEDRPAFLGRQPGAQGQWVFCLSWLPVWE